MKGLKIALAAILTVLAVSLAVGMVGIMTGRLSFPGNWIMGDWGISGGWVEESYGNATLQADTEVPADDVRGIDVNYSKTGCDIYFLPSQDGALRVKEYYNEVVEDKKKAKIGMSGSTLMIQQRLYPGNVGMKRVGGYVEVYLPADTYAALKNLEASTTSGDITLPKWDGVTEMSMEKLDLSTTSGDIDVDFMQSEEAELNSTSGNLTVGFMSGNLSMNATSGDLEVSEMIGSLTMSGTSGNQTAGNVRGDLDMGSTSGDLKAENVTGDVVMDTVSGWQQVNNMTGKGDFGSTSGDITVGVKEWNGDVICDSTSGSVDITVPKGSSFSVDIDSTSGYIDTDFDDDLTFNKRHTSAAGNIGGSPQYRIKVETTSGGVEVHQK